MKNILMITMALFILIVGITCATAIHLDMEKEPKVIDIDHIIKSSGKVSTNKIPNHRKQLGGIVVFEQGRLCEDPKDHKPRGYGIEKEIEELSKKKGYRIINETTLTGKCLEPIKFSPSNIPAKMEGGKLYEKVNGTIKEITPPKKGRNH